MKEIPYALRKQVGLQFLLDQMAPASPYGTQWVRKPVRYEPAEREALLREWRNVGRAVAALEASPAAVDRLNHLMMQMHDIRATLARCHETVLTEVELFEVKRFLLQLALLVPQYAASGLALEGITLTEETGALALLDPEGKRAAGFAIGGGLAGPLAEIREEKRQIEAKLRETPEGTQRDALMNERTLVVAREEAEMLAVRRALSESLRAYADALLANTDMIGRLDFILQKAALSQRWHMAMPSIGEAVRMEAMENPEIAEALSQQRRAFTRVSMEAALGATVITGANMGGKSVAIRTLTLNVLLCQAGFFACARQAALPLFDEVVLACEDLADASAGLSSFGAEVLQLKDILSRVLHGSFCFVALDEPARGTNPQEGAALVRALVTRLSGLRCVAVLATHYGGVARAAGAHYQAAGLRDLPLDRAGDDPLRLIAQHMNYGLVRVDVDEKPPREALTVCRLLGLDDEVVEAMAALLHAGNAPDDG